MILLSVNVFCVRAASLFSFNKKCEKYPEALVLNYFYITSRLHKYYIGSLSAASRVTYPDTCNFQSRARERVAIIRFKLTV